MTFRKNNKYWHFREKHGRNKIYTPETLWEKAVEYFEWVEENPLYEEKLFQNKGEIIRDKVYKMRAMTLTGLCIFLGISGDTFKNYAKNSDFLEVANTIKDIINSQKFEGAAADLLNANIIARDLGLKEKTENEQNVKLDAPISLQVNFDDFSEPGDFS